MVKTKNGLSGEAIKILTNKPFVEVAGVSLSAQLFYIDDHTIEIGFIGFYPIAGEFMKGMEE